MVASIVRHMPDNLRDQLVKLEQAIAELEKVAKLSLGFVERIEYRDVWFDLSKKFVIADMAPLAFFHLVEPIDQDGKDAAIERLYDRLLPLLTCRHQWTVLKRASDKPLLRIGHEWTMRGDGPHVCRQCTAYVLGGTSTSLPIIGRNLG